jgi:(p)ppGpp synthase/HD superfamily hydrolase
LLLNAYDDVGAAPGKGLPHAQAVADVPRDTGYTQDIQVADPLHDVAEDTACTIDDVRVKFAEHIGRQVADLTEDTAIDSTTSASARCAIRSRLPHRRRSTSRWPTRSPRSTTPR